MARMEPTTITEWLLSTWGLHFRISAAEDEALEPVTSVRGETCYLHVWDMDIRPTSHDAASITVWRTADVDAQLAALQPAKDGHVRIFVEDFPRAKPAPLAPATTFIPGRATEPFTLREGPGFGALAAQWKHVNPDRWFSTETFDYLPLDASQEAAWRGRKLHRVSWARVARKILFRKSADGRPLVFISCQTYMYFRWLSPGDKRIRLATDPFKITERYVTELKALNETYRVLRTQDNWNSMWKKLFLLQHHHATLNVFTDFLHQFSENYVGRQKEASDPRHSSKLRQWNLRSLSRASHIYQQLVDAGSEMTTTIESLLNLIRVSIGSEQAFLELDADLKGCCREVQDTLSRFPRNLEQDLRFLQTARELDQATSVKQLTILGALFLPMSLAAGILSMQSRFKELGLRLYDFFGVAILLDTIAIFLLGFLSIVARLSDFVSILEVFGMYRRNRQVAFAVFMSGTIFTLGGLLLSSFAVGMFKDAIIGAKILGFGVAAITASPIVVLLLIIVACIIGKCFA